MIYDALIVGGGVSGLTAAAYLAQYGRRVVLCEKEPLCGGLVNSFERDGFVYDSGIRALEDAGVMMTMLRQLGLQIDFVKNPITLGIEDQVMLVESEHSIDAYGKMLMHLYPESQDEVSAIIEDLRLITRYMDIQYGIDNPLFLDPKKDGEYFMKKVFPWMLKYALNVGKVQSKDKPVIPYLRQFTQNQALLDVITQHFFTDTPAYFALSYFKIFQEYYYPKGGTITFIKKLLDFIQQHGGEVRTNAPIISLNLAEKNALIEGGQTVQFRQLLWTADQKKLYEGIDPATIQDARQKQAFEERKALIADMSGNDSILSVYLSSHLDRAYFEKVSTGHFFYTPSRKGQSAAGQLPLDGSQPTIKAWLDAYLPLTSYEISIPVLRDGTLAPAGKTGLIISLLFDYRLTKTIQQQGWYEEFKQQAARRVIETLDRTVYPGLAASVIESFCATPLTLERSAGTTQGAITGWSFTNHPVPAENRLVRIANAIKTPLAGVFQAGQWSYSPAGFPVSLITGKLAADKVHKSLKK